MYRVKMSKQDLKRFRLRTASHTILVFFHIKADRNVPTGTPNWGKIAMFEQRLAYARFYQLRPALDPRAGPWVARGRTRNAFYERLAQCWPWANLARR